MKKLSLLFLFSSLTFAISTENRTMDYLIQSQKMVEYGYNVKAYENSRYHYEKAKTYNEAAVLLASYGDSIGSQLFAIKSFNSLVKALLSNNQLDSLEISSEKGLAEKIKYVRDNKGISCAPESLGKAEAYYELLSYELTKEKPNEVFLFDLRNKISKWIKDAQDRVDVAKKEGLSCYAGKLAYTAKPVEVSQVKEEPKEEEIVTKPKEEAKEERVLEKPLKLEARIHFDFNKYDIKKEYIPVLNEVVKVMKENPNMKLKVIGYTDDIGSKSYNDKLAMKRAQAVKEYLVKQGIEASRIEIVGIGKANYIAENTTAIGRFTNRRAEFVSIEITSE